MLFWLRHFITANFVSFSLDCNRDGAQNKDGTDRVHLLSWRPLWTLSWVQLHLLIRDHLLGNCCSLQVWAQMWSVLSPFFCSGTIGGRCPRIETLLGSQQNMFKAHLKRKTALLSIETNWFNYTHCTILKKNWIGTYSFGNVTMRIFSEKMHALIVKKNFSSSAC